MGGNGRHHVIAVNSSDSVLSLVASLGMGFAVGTALVIDDSKQLETERTLVDFAEEGPRLADLSPGRTGVAVLSTGRLDDGDALDIVMKLARRWPAVVVREGSESWPLPTVPFEPIIAGRLAPVSKAPLAVWQPTSHSSTAPGPGPVMPRMSKSEFRDLLDGRSPRRGRWVRSLRPLWEMPWE